MCKLLKSSILGRFERDRILLLACVGLIAAGYAHAQAARIPARAVDGAAQAFDTVGRAWEYVFGSGWDLGTTRGTPYTSKRNLDERLPASPGAVVSIDNEFGHVRIGVWDERVVQVRGEVTVRASSTEIAARIARTVGMEARARGGSIAIQTLFPEPPRYSDPLSYEGAITVTVPRDADVMVRNTFGDTEVAGLSGKLTLHARYGSVFLQQLEGAADVRVDGAFPVRVRSLRGGGTFQLNGPFAEFRDLAGSLLVRCFQGSLDIDVPAAAALIDVRAEGAPVRIGLPGGAEIDVRSQVRYGSLESPWPVFRPADSLSRTENLRPAADAKVEVDASFADVRLEWSETSHPLRPPNGGADMPESKPYSETATRTETAPPDSTLFVDAIIGDIRIEADDGNVITLGEERQVWTSAASQAPKLLEGMKVALRRETGRVVVTSSMDDTAEPASNDHRIDLTIRCPKSMPVEIHAAHGLTYIAGLASSINVVQGAGTLAIQESAGKLSLENGNGRIQVTDCQGELKMAVRRGDALVRGHTGPVRIEGEGGPVRIERVDGDMYIRNSGNDVRILAQDGLSGAIDAQIAFGNLSLALPATPGIDLSATSVGGVVRSIIPLTGTVDGDRQDFHAVLGDGRNRIRLEVLNGDLYVN